MTRHTVQINVFQFLGAFAKLTLSSIRFLRDAKRMVARLLSVFEFFIVCAAVCSLRQFVNAFTSELKKVARLCDGDYKLELDGHPKRLRISRVWSPD